MSEGEKDWKERYKVREYRLGPQPPIEYSERPEMTDAEKLKALIEMAWENGYPKWLRREYYPAISTAVNGEEYVDYEAEHTLFDHEFVKSLCRAKWGSHTEPRKVEMYNDYQEWEDWELLITKLALSIDRVGYLSSIFLEDRFDYKNGFSI